jgi:aldehyde:ferredoxin oxidoreductase
MSFGSTSKILWVDLTASSLRIEEFDEDFYRLYPGGKALAGYLVLRETPAHTDPLGPENVFVLAVGLLTGSPLATATRFTAAARSPLTGAYGESEAGGFWGPELKQAGFDAIVVKGRAPAPVYLWIHDGEAEIKNAAHLWGVLPDAAQAILREEVSSEKARVLQIGAGGENLVRFAGLTNELRHFNARNGMGAVMGSKNLKAVAVRGTTRYLQISHTPKLLAELGRRLAKQAQENPISWDLHMRGTPALVEGLNASGMLPTHNFHTGVFEGADRINSDAYAKEILTDRRSCFACAVRCKREVAVDGRVSEYGGPEYEAVAAFGSLCGNDDLQVIAKANELCNQYTLDVISTGATIAFAMECFERGLIDLETTGGLDLRFGNTSAMLQAVEWIAHRQGFGNLLAEGSRRAAEVIGGEAPHFAMQVKGQELAMHDPRGKANVGVGYAVSEIGADHLVSIHDTLLQNPNSLQFQGAKALGITQAFPARSLNAEKMQQYLICENWVSLEKAIGYCYFGPTPRSFIQVDDVIASVQLATGWDVTLDELLRMGERATNLARVFNIREGFSRQDDTLPERLFEPIEGGPLMGAALSHAEFEAALTTLYQLKGWDPITTIPDRQRLDELQIGWAADLLGATA